MILRHIASEDLHGADTDTQGKERLGHGAEDHVADPRFFHILKTGNKVKLHAFHGAVQCQRMNSQNHDQSQKAEHHHLGDPLHALLQSQRTDAERQKHCQDHPESHRPCGMLKIRKILCYLFRISAFQFAGRHYVTVIHGPSCDHGVEHHQDIISDHAHPAVFVKIRTFWFQGVHGFRRALAARPSYCKLADQDRQSHTYQKYQVDQHKSRAAILSCHIWKFPHIPEADGAACGYKDETKP